MSDEQTPETRADLFANQNATHSTADFDAVTPSAQQPAPLVPAQPQFSSRREMRNAAPAVRKATPSPRGASVASRPPARSSKLTRKERALARKLTVTPTPRVMSSSKPTKRQHPLLGALVVLVVSGFVALGVLPAYAFTPVAPGTMSEAAKQNNDSNTQNLAVDATIETNKVSREQIKATTDAEYKAQQITATTLLSSAGLSSVVQPHQAGDDYPWPNAGNTLSPLHYFYRQCVDFVAWRLNRDAGVTSAPWKWTWQNLTPNGGNASQWKSAWEAHGWKTSATPVIGSVAWFVGNHVAYVKSVQGSNVVIEEYNGTSSRSYAMRTIPIDTVGRFLYPPP